jgi:hypothetical protein
MRYIRDSALVIAWEDVHIRFKDENVLIIADSVRHYSDLGLSYFYGNPHFRQIDSSTVRTFDGESDSLLLDTLSILADYMEARRDTSNSFLTEGNVRIVRGTLAALCDRADFLRSDSLMLLRGEPVLWHEENQVTGDSIAAFVVDNELRTLDVVGNAFSISRSKPAEQDTLWPPGRFDQTKGRHIQMQFAEKKPQRIRIEETAVSLYYVYEEGKLNGVRHESSDLIIIDFDDGEVHSIRSIRGVEGTYYPEKMVTGREHSYNLEGFQWRDDRPVMPIFDAEAGATDYGHPDTMQVTPDVPDSPEAPDTPEKPSRAPTVPESASGETMTPDVAPASTAPGRQSSPPSPPEDGLHESTPEKTASPESGSEETATPDARQ